MPQSKTPKLGQNFLKLSRYARLMANTVGIETKQTILEIGPGKGILTQELLNTGARVIAVEKDSGLILYLNNSFTDYIKRGQLLLIEGDILEFSLTQDLLANKPYKVAANIPYYITGAILKKLLSSVNQPISITILVQKEVAERIIAKDGKESILSVSVKAFGNPKIITKVRKQHFSPKPKVDSSILHIDNISRKYLSDNALDENKFFEVIRAGFSKKRKLLTNCLKSDYPTINDVLITCGLSPKIRAEDVSIKSWACIVKGIN